MKISTTRQKAIADDLLRKFPQGGERRRKMVRKDFTSRYEYCGLADGYRTLTFPDAEEGTDLFYRYTPEELFHCGWSDEYEARKFIRVAYPEVGSRGWTQRARRLVRRTKPARRHLAAAGEAGIYRLSYRSPYGADAEVYDRTVKIYATSKAEAEALASMMLSPYFQHKEGRLNIQYVEPGNVMESLACFTDFQARNDKLVETCKKEITDLQEKIAALKMQSDAFASVTSDLVESA